MRSGVPCPQTTDASRRHGSASSPTPRLRGAPGEVPPEILQGPKDWPQGLGKRPVESTAMSPKLFGATAWKSSGVKSGFCFWTAGPG